MLASGIGRRGLFPGLKSPRNEHNNDYRTLLVGEKRGLWLPAAVASLLLMHMQLHESHRLRRWTK
jgi:hypothetical protein